MTQTEKDMLGDMDSVGVRSSVHDTVSKLWGVCKTVFKMGDIAVYLLSHLNSDTLGEFSLFF